LSEDEGSIETDYSVQIIEAYHGNERAAVGRNIIVSRPGGMLMIDGRAITSFERDFPSFLPGEEYVLFVRFDPQRRLYIVPRGAQGAFRDVDGFVAQVSRSEGKISYERGKLQSSAFAQEVRDLASAIVR
jgi:hypothetical protein